MQGRGLPQVAGAGGTVVDRREDAVAAPAESENVFGLRIDTRRLTSLVALLVPLALFGCAGSAPGDASADASDTHGTAQQLSRTGRPIRPNAPDRFSAFGRRYAFSGLRNPVREGLLAQFVSDPNAARVSYAEAVKAGRDLYFQNCVHCHGDLLDGEGLFSLGQTPSPSDFRGQSGIAQLTEPYLFWRIALGGPGLPRDFAPWNSMMPVGEEILSAVEIWTLVIFLYDRIGEVPRGWSEQTAETALGMHAEAQAARATLSGKELYRSLCAACHGQTGAGDGPAAAFLYPAPRDFTIGLFKYKTSDSETLQPMDEDIFRVIKFGLPRTAMPSWGAHLSDEQIRSLVEVVKGLDQVGTWAPEDAPDSAFDEAGYYQGEFVSFDERQAAKARVPFSEKSVAEGRKHFEENCSPCHGAEGRGSPSASKKLRDDWGARIWPRDLTKPWTWRVTEVAGSREETIGNIFTRLSVGIPGTPMPEHATNVPAQARWHIANYVYTLRDTTPALSDSPVIHALETDSPLPVSVDEPVWATAQPMTMVLVPNVLRGGRLFRPLNDSMTIRVVYNEKEIAFLLEIDDRTYSRPGDPDAETIRDPALEMYPDAFAIQLPKKGAFTLGAAPDLPLFRHGDTAHPTTIWYWRAESVEPAISPKTLVLDAAGAREGPRPRPDDASVSASGKWLNGRWRVMMKRTRVALDPRDLAFTDGEVIPVSFASWDGSNGESGSRHLLSSWYWLSLGDDRARPPEQD